MEVKARRIRDNFFVLLDFSNFSLKYIKIYTFFKCKVKNCEYQKYSNLLRNFLVRSNKCEQEKKKFFSSHCELQSNFFVI